MRGRGVSMTSNCANTKADCGAYCDDGLRPARSGASHYNRRRSDFAFPAPPPPPLNAPLGVARGLAVDPPGNIYIPDSGNNLVFRLTPNGILSVFAGNGINDTSGDGVPATSAAVGKPSAIRIIGNLDKLALLDRLNVFTAQTGQERGIVCIHSCYSRPS